MSSTKPVLYYSQYCPSCDQVLRILTHMGIQTQVAYACVDARVPPPFVDRVPLLATSTCLLSDDALHEYLMVIGGSAAPRSGTRPPPHVPAPAHVLPPVGGAVVGGPHMSHAPSGGRGGGSDNAIALGAAEDVSASMGAYLDDHMATGDEQAQRRAQFGFLQIEGLRPDDNYPAGAFTAHSTLPPPAETASKRGGGSGSSGGSASAGMYGGGGMTRSGGADGDMEALVAERNQSLSTWFHQQPRA